MHTLILNMKNEYNSFISNCPRNAKHLPIREPRANKKFILDNDLRLSILN